jgi:tellurite resistance protein TerC
MVVKNSAEEDLEKNFFIKLLNKLFKVYPKIDDEKFLKKINGSYFVTPLFLALIFIEM